MTKWWETAACRGAPLDWFFPPTKLEAPKFYAKARAICDECPHSGPDGACLADAIHYGDTRDGMRGGFSPRQMKRTEAYVSRPRKVGRRVTRARVGRMMLPNARHHGTIYGYRAGCRCDPCTLANTIKSRRRST